ncbi:chemotaxis protein CheW [Chitinivorax sp. B]|uniref:chemotaxis protein CheW n=1 Tax=Chitinivorax sp. B TaxID=2502235 RepID=UPI0010F791BD|nr:chemotaxis protein CheW [Chitinivorax sp. B]
MTQPNRLTTIDWQNFHRRLAQAHIALQGSHIPSADAIQVKLQQRAKALAVVPALVAEQAQQELLTFMLGYEHYGIESSWIREVCPLKELTVLPGVPPFVAGIIHLRGQIVSVINLKYFFELPAQGLTDLNKVIVLQDDAMCFGILADQIINVCQIPLTAIQPALPTLTGVRAAYLLGITADHLIVLDAGRLLHDPGLIVDQSLA